MYVLNQATAISMLSDRDRYPASFSISFLALQRLGLAATNLYKISHRLLYVHCKTCSFV